MKRRVIRLVTYNIHKGIGGVDRKYRLERVIDVLERCRPDLALLQEVDEGVPRSRGHRQVDLIGDELGLPHRAYFPNVRLRRGHYGNALLSRFPFDHEQNIDLTLPFKKRRAALHVRFTAGGNPRGHRVWLFNVHLGLAGYERRTQLRTVLTYLRRHHVRRDTAQILAGDMNDVWGTLGPRVLLPVGFRSVARPAATFPAARPLRALDRVFVRGPVDLVSCRRSRAMLARQASDHLPIIARIALRG